MSLPRFTFTTRARPFLEIGVGDPRIDTGVGRWDVAHWDNAADATWSGVEPLWLDYTCESFEVATSIGRQRVTDAFSPGTASVMLRNLTGWADPHPPGTDPALLTLRPGRAIRVGVDHTTLGRRVLFRGFIDRTEPRYDPSGHDVVALSAIDALGEVGRVNLAAVADPGVGAGELAGTRFHRILDAAKWSTHKRSLMQTGVAMAATTFGKQTVDEMTQTADSAGGACFGDTAGNVCFRARDWQTYEPGDPLDATIGNIAAGEACPSSWVLSSDRQDIITQVILGRTVDPTPFTYDDLPGQSLYGIEPYTRTDLICQSTSILNTLAARILRTRGYRVTPRVERVELSAATSPEALDVATIATPYEPSRIRCRLLLSRGVIFDAEMFVTGVRHTITPEAWLCALDLDWAKPFESAAGRWDGDEWDQALWSGGPSLTEALESLHALEAA